MRRLIAYLSNFRRDRRGSVLIEFVLIMPCIMLLVLGGAEAGRYLLIGQKLDRVVSSAADLVSQEEAITTAEMNGIFTAVGQVFNPFTLGANGVVIVSSISLVGGTPRINWQRRGAGSLGTASAIGSQGGSAALPAGLVVRAGETIIATEVYYNFTPLFSAGAYTDVFIARTLRNQSFFRPRLGTLTTIS